MELLCATPEPASLSVVTLGLEHCHLLSLPRTGLSNGSLEESAPLPVQQQENKHQQTPSPPAWIPVLLQDTYLYFSQCGLGAADAWTPLCCPLRTLLPWPWQCRGAVLGGRGVPAGAGAAVFVHP